MIAVKLAFQIDRKCAQINYGDPIFRHHAVRQPIVFDAVNGITVEAHIRAIVFSLIKKRRSHPDQFRSEVANRLHNRSEILLVLTGRHLLAACSGIGFDVMKTAVQQKEIGINAARTSLGSQEGQDRR